MQQENLHNDECVLYKYLSEPVWWNIISEKEKS